MFDPPVARRAAALVALGAALAVAPAARADADGGEGSIYGGAMSVVMIAGYAIEIAIPDFRLQIGPRDHRWALSFPLVIHGGHARLGERRAIGFAHFLEVQYQPTREAKRVALGERLILFDREASEQGAPILELGGLAGQDGSGGFVGLGYVLGVPEVGITIGLVGRLVFTDQERRGDLALDLQLPFGLDL